MQLKNDNTDCGFIRLNLFSYRENTLSPGEREMFEVHCRSCEECGRLVSGFSSFEALMEEKKAAAPGPFIHTRTIRKIEDFLEQDKKPHYIFSGRVLRPAMAAFIVLFALLIGFSIGRQADAKFTTGPSSRLADIQTMQSDLFITDIMDENVAMLDNQYPPP
jgi:hypothetical protein